MKITSLTRLTKDHTMGTYYYPAKDLVVTIATNYTTDWDLTFHTNVAFATQFLAILDAIYPNR